MNIPQYCNHQNAIVEVTNNELTRFFYKYLLQKAISVFRWELPETWARDYFLYTLYCNGHVAVINTDKYGVIPQHCSLHGYDVMYRPTTATINNPLLRGFNQLRIGKQCEIFKVNPDYSGIMDIVKTYGDVMALCVQTAGVNLLNSKLSYIFAAKTEASAKSFYKMMEDVINGKPAVAVDKSLFNNDGSKAWDTFTQNVGQNYIAGAVLSDLRKWEALFNTEIGIPNANTDKAERLIADEVNANNVETGTKCEMWLESFKKTCADCKKMFNIDISVDWRVPPVYNKGGVV